MRYKYLYVYPNPCPNKLDESTMLEIHNYGRPAY